MSPLTVLPDAVLVTRAYLLTVSELTALVGTRIATRSHSTPAYPYVRLQRIGGTAAVRNRLDAARLQAEAYGADEASASTTARTLLAALLAMEGYTTASVTVTGVEEELGPQWLPDDVRTPATPRFVLGVSVYLHPLP